MNIKKIPDHSYSLNNYFFLINQYFFKLSVRKTMIFLLYKELDSYKLVD